MARRLHLSHPANVALDGDVSVGGPMNDAGQVLAQVMIGRSTRLMRLLPADPCTGGCIRSSALQMHAMFVPDPNDPGHCTPNASNRAWVELTVTSETGAPLSGVLVRGRFLDDYWTNTPASATTNSSGVACFALRGPACVGAIAFLVDIAKKDGLVFDKTVGVLTGWVIPQ